MIWDKMGFGYSLRGTKWTMLIDRVQCWVYYKYSDSTSSYNMVMGTFTTFEEACDYIEEQK